MERIYEKSIAHEGNDCWISEEHEIYEIDDNHYLAVKVTVITGSWAPADPVSVDTAVCSSEDEAKKYLKKA